MPIVSANYWKSEHNKLHKRVDADAKDLDVIYRAKLKQVEAQIEAFYTKYAVENVITVKQAKTLLTAKEFREFNAKLRLWIKNDTYISDKSFIATIDRLAGTSKINRLQRLEAEITANLSELKQTHLESMEDSLIKTFEETEEATQKVIDIDFKQTSEYKMRVVINTEFQGRRFSPRVWTQRSNLGKKLFSTMLDNFSKGSNWLDLKADLKRSFGVSDFEARRLLITETARINSIAKESSFTDAGFSMYQYIAVSDDKTTQICNNLDDKIFRLEDMIVGVNAPPTHIYCRSTIVPYEP